MKKMFSCILSCFFLGCTNPVEEKRMIHIDKNWDIEKLKLNQSTLEDFERVMSAKDIAFAKDSLVYFNTLKDSTFKEINYTLTNKDLGLYFQFERTHRADSALLVAYEITQFNIIQFDQDYTNVISKAQLERDFKADLYRNLYETTVGENHVLMGVVPKSESTFEIIAINIYPN